MSDKTLGREANRIGFGYFGDHTRIRTDSICAALKNWRKSWQETVALSLLHPVSTDQLCLAIGCVHGDEGCASEGIATSGLDPYC